MNDVDPDLRRQLRSWDPLARLGDPDPRAVAEVREAIQRAAGSRRGLVPMLAVAVLTATVLVPLLLLPPGTPVAPVSDAARPVNLEFQASNGVRIHWSVYPKSPADDRRSLRSEERP